MVSKASRSLLVILAVLTTLPVLAPVSGGSASSMRTSAESPRQHPPMKFHRFRADGTVESENWSGYAVTGSSFKFAIGSWTVPPVDCSASGGTPNSYAAFWVGIDGYSSNTVEQIGTDSDCNGTTPDYYAWYEFYPKFSVNITSVAVSVGDHMSAEVTYNGSEFTVTISNESTGSSYSHSQRVNGAKRTSAEWIAEAPCCTNKGAVLPLSNFGILSLGSDYTGFPGTNDATGASASGPISDFGLSVEEIIMVSAGGAEESVPSGLTSDGSSFQATWKSE